MNILPHKSWHVRTKRNIEKVRRDERKAAEKEKVNQERALLAEQEARTNYLRKRARGVTAVDTDTVDNGAAKVDEIHDIFQDVKDGKGDQRKNLDHEKEAKEEKESWEKKVGILTYLNQKDSEVEKPWYLGSHEQRMNLKDDKMSKEDVKEMKTKSSNDPLNDMRRYLDIMKKNHGSDDGDEDEKRKKKKKSKSDRRSDDKKSKDHKAKSIEELRAERLKREKVERERTKKLLLGDVEEPKKSTYIEPDDRKRAYNSQFNPFLAKQNRPVEHHHS